MWLKTHCEGHPSRPLLVAVGALLSGPLEGGKLESIIWSFHLDTLRVPKLVPHPALQPGAEVVDLSRKENEGFPGSGGLESGPPGPDFEGFRARAEG